MANEQFLVITGKRIVTLDEANPDTKWKPQAVEIVLNDIYILRPNRMANVISCTHVRY
jgi:hypothetical protein